MGQGLQRAHRATSVTRVTAGDFKILKATIDCCADKSTDALGPIDIGISMGKDTQTAAGFVSRPLSRLLEAGLVEKVLREGSAGFFYRPTDAGRNSLRSST